MCRDPFRYFSPESQHLQLADMARLRLKTTEETTKAKTTYRAFVGMNDLVRQYLAESAITKGLIPIERARNIVSEMGSSWVSDILIEHHAILTERNKIEKAEADLQQRREVLMRRRTDVHQLLVAQNMAVGVRRTLLPPNPAGPSSLLT